MTDLSDESNRLIADESLIDLVNTKQVIIMTGSGGVGKTSCAAALAIGASLVGIDTCVVTIDPAKRLADALGLDEIGNDPVEIQTLGQGKLYAVMLDADATFDDLIVRYANSPDQAEKILANTVYQNLTKNLSGIQEYMAMEKLFELHNDNRFKLLIVDTPPSANALDFLDAPRRLIGFLDNKVFRVIMNTGPSFLKPVSFATKAVLKAISRVVGAEVVDQAVAFFQDFEGMQDGFRARAEIVQELLRQDQTAFVLVTSPRGDTIQEAQEFGLKLIGFGFRIAGLISNRETPDFEKTRISYGPEIDVEQHDRKILSQTLTEMKDLRSHEQLQLTKLTRKLEPPRLVHIPTLLRDVANMEDLAQVAKHLLSENKKT